MNKIETGIPAEALRFLSPNLGGSIAIQKDTQKTEPSLPLARSFPRADLGDSGTRILHGIIQEEYNPQLQGIEGIRIFDEMRKSDGTVRAAVLACVLPILRAEWFIKEANDTPAAKEQAEFVRHAIFDWIEDMTWEDILRQSLLMIPFGVMLFEKVYGTYEFAGKKYVTLKKLAPRLPKSILMWELTDHTFGIQQIRQDGVLAQIPGSKLLIFVNEREGDNWWGTSMLRSAYQHWYHKSKYYAIDGIGFERQSLGVPYAKMPPTYTDADEKKAEAVLANLRANERSFLVYPNTIEVGFMDMGAKSVRDPATAIDHHNKQILLSVLAQFLELGASKSGGGSRALSQDHSDLFLKSMEAIAKNVVATVNRGLIRELIDLNFDNVEEYPVLNYSTIEKTDITAFGTAISQMVTAGGLTMTPSDQQFIRSIMGLPPRTPEEIAEDENDQVDEETLIEEGVEEDEDDPPAGQEVEKTAQQTAAKKQAKKSKTSAPGKPEKPVPAQAHSHHGKNLKRTFNITPDFMSWRPITMAETKVDWGKMQTQMDDLEAQFKGPALALLTKTKDEYMAKVHELLQKNDAPGLATLTLDFEDKYRKILVTAMTQAHAYGRTTATQELGYGSRPAATTEDTASIDMLASAIAAKTAADISAIAKIAVANALKSSKPTLQSSGQIDKDVSDAIDKSVSDTSSILVGQGVNNGRNSVFDRNSDDIHGLQRSEILDRRTCNFCLSMDGRIVEPGDEWASTDIFHSNCRGIWVAILKDEVNPPPVDGVPSSVADYYGGRTNDLLQPRVPLTKPGGLAEQYVKQQQATRQ